MKNRLANYIRCFYCNRIFSSDEVDSHLCFKGKIVRYYFDTAFPNSVIISNGKNEYRTTWNALKALLQTPKLNALKKLGINPDNLPVLFIKTLII